MPHVRLAVRGANEQGGRGNGDRMLKLVRALVAPERLYMAALGLSGLAALFSIALASNERGVLSATMAGATLGSAIGGVSIDTFFMSRPKGWVWGRGVSWIASILLGCLVLSGGVAAVIIAFIGFGNYAVAIGASCCLTIFNACSSLALRIQQFRFVYAVRATAALTLLAGYGWFWLAGERSGLVWSTAYAIAQAIAALALSVAVVRWATQRRPQNVIATPDRTTSTRKERLVDLSSMGKVHVGVSAAMVTSRLDQLLLARFVGESALGVYSLAVAAMEFAQAGAVVRSQKILTNPDQAESIPKMSPVVKATLPVAVCSVLGLAALGILRPDYHQAWLFGLLILPGAVGAALGKTWSAALLMRRGEMAASAVAVVAAVVAVPIYFLFISTMDTIGAAMAVSCIYGVYALGAFWSLRTQPTLTVERGVI